MLYGRYQAQGKAVPKPPLLVSGSQDLITQSWGTLRAGSYLLSGSFMCGLLSLLCP